MDHRNKKGTILIILTCAVAVISLATAQQVTTVDDNNNDGNNVFTPTVTALCTNSKIIVTTQTDEPFYGVVTSRGLRNNSACFVEGQGATSTVLELNTNNLPSDPSDPEFCRIISTQGTGEKSVHVSVRQHKTLELANDKNYLVQCNKLNSAPPAVPLPARLYLSTSSSSPRPLKEVINARSYKLILKTNHAHFNIKNCIAFGTDSSATTFFDQQGCPVSRITSRWTSTTPTTSETTIFQMFRFQDSNQVTLQCTITFCESTCPTPTSPCSDTPNDSTDFYKPTNPLPLTNSTTTTSVIASTTVNVLNPGDKLALSIDDSEDVCTGRFCPVWLLWVAITLGVLFLLMLLVNLCLCTALTCTCTRTELVERDPSILEDYDPYNNRTWEQYSNHNKQFSESIASADHYATPTTNNGQHHLRPDSRFSHKK